MDSHNKLTNLNVIANNKFIFPKVPIYLENGLAYFSEEYQKRIDSIVLVLEDAYLDNITGRFESIGIKRSGLHWKIPQLFVDAIDSVHHTDELLTKLKRTVLEAKILC